MTDEQKPAGQQQEESPFTEIAERDTMEVLQSAISTKSKTHIWTEGRAHQMVGRISKVANSESVILIAVPKDKKFEQSLETSGTEDVLISVQLPSDLIYFKAKVKRSDEVAFSFMVVQPLYKVQRRQAIRVPVPSDMSSPVQITIPGRSTPIKATMLNISVGGVGVLTQDMSLEENFQIGMAAEVSFQFGTLPVRTQATLRYLQKVQGSLVGKRLKIGVQFEGIHSKTQDEIHIFVMNESVKYLGRRPF